MLAQRVIQDSKLQGSTSLEKIFYLCQRTLKYHPDPITAEMLIWPQEMARQIWDYLYEGSKVQPMGDCDDKTCILMAMLLNRRYTCKAIGAWQSQYSSVRTINHVYVELKADSQSIDQIRKALGNPNISENSWIPLEPSSLTLPFGKQRAEVYPIKEYIARVDGVIIN